MYDGEYDRYLTKTNNFCTKFERNTSAVKSHGGTHYCKDCYSEDRYSDTQLPVYTERVKLLGLCVVHDVPPQAAQCPCDLSELRSREQRSSE